MPFGRWDASAGWGSVRAVLIRGGSSMKSIAAPKRPDDGAGRDRPMLEAKG
jgi:hypothetical protein